MNDYERRVRSVLSTLETTALYVLSQLHAVDPIAGYRILSYDSVNEDSVYFSGSDSNNDYDFEIPLSAVLDSSALATLLSERNQERMKREEREAKRQEERKHNTFVLVSPEDYELLQSIKAQRIGSA